MTADRTVGIVGVSCVSVSLCLFVFDVVGLSVPFSILLIPILTLAALILGIIGLNLSKKAKTNNKTLNIICIIISSVYLVVYILYMTLMIVGAFALFGLAKNMLRIMLKGLEIG